MTSTFKGADIVYLIGMFEAAGSLFDKDVDFIAAFIKIGNSYKQAIQKAGIKKVIYLSARAAFDDRSIKRGIIVAEGNHIACQTWIEGKFVREFTQSPAGPLPPNGKQVVFDLINIFRFDDQGRLVEEWVHIDSHLCRLNNSIMKNNNFSKNKKVPENYTSVTPWIKLPLSCHFKLLP